MKASGLISVVLFLLFVACNGTSTGAEGPTQQAGPPKGSDVVVLRDDGTYPELIEIGQTYTVRIAGVCIARMKVLQIESGGWVRAEGIEGCLLRDGDVGWWNVNTGQAIESPVPPPAETPLELMLPLLGGRSWLLNVEAGGKIASHLPPRKLGEPNYHSDDEDGYYALDFDDITEDGKDWSGGHAPVLAAADGTVHEVGINDLAGNFVRIDHGDRYFTLYAHLRKKPELRPEEEVVSGQCIGVIGNTGTGSNGEVGVHLHFEVQYNRKSRSDIPELDEVLLQGEKIVDYYKVEPSRRFYPSKNVPSVDLESCGTSPGADSTGSNAETPPALAPIVPPVVAVPPRPPVPASTVPVPVAETPTSTSVPVLATGPAPAPGPFTFTCGWRDPDMDILLVSAVESHNEIQLTFKLSAHEAPWNRNPDLEIALFYAAENWSAPGSSGGEAIHILDDRGHKYYTTTGFVGGRQSLGRIRLKPGEEAIISAKFPRPSEDSRTLRFVSPIDGGGHQLEWWWDGIILQASPSGVGGGC